MEQLVKLSNSNNRGEMQTFPEKGAPKISALSGIIDQVLTPLSAWND
jgi:hypothetical protein